MKFHTSLPLALALTAGMAGAAVAQTTASPNAVMPSSPQTTMPGSANSWNAQHPQSSYALPQNESTAPQASHQPQAMTGQMQPVMQPQASGNQQVSEAQQRLQADGLYNGPADGMMDPNTRAAIAKFQGQHGLQRTERLDQPTLAALNSQTPGSGSSSGMSSMTPPPPTANEGANQGQSMAPTSAGGNTTGQPMNGQPTTR